MGNYVHSKHCLAEAVISAVQNIRDDENVTDTSFTISLQDNDPLHDALMYLEDGTHSCTCGAKEYEYHVTWFWNETDDGRHDLTPDTVNQIFDSARLKLPNADTHPNAEYTSKRFFNWVYNVLDDMKKGDG